GGERSPSCPRLTHGGASRCPPRKLCRRGVSANKRPQTGGPRRARQLSRDGRVFQRRTSRSAAAIGGFAPAMKLVVFGLSVSSSWGNGHAVLWRALIRALVSGGHFVVFFERDVPWYAQHRDLTEIEGGRLVLYGAWDEVRIVSRRELDDADAEMVHSSWPHVILDSAV